MHTLTAAGGAATAASSSSSSSSKLATSRSRQVIILLLCLVLLVQLYILHVWMSSDGASGGGGGGGTFLENLRAASKQGFRGGSGCNCGGCIDASSPPTSENAKIALAVLSKYVELKPAVPTLGGGLAIAAPGSSPVDESGDVIISKIREHAAPVLVRHHGGAGHKPSTADVVHHHDLGEKQHSAAFLSKHASLYSHLRLNFSRNWADDQLDPMRHHGMSEEDQARRLLCLSWFRKHNVLVEAEWGSLPKELHAEFDAKGCSEIISQFQVANFIVNNTHLYDRVWAVDPDRVIPQPDAPLTHKDTIAIIVSMTTRGITIKTSIVQELVLFKTLLPSLVKTVEPGFEYWFYLGYDKGDEILDQAATRDLIDRWFAEHVTAKAWAEKQVRIKLVWSTWVNPWAKPGPAFNYVCGQAYADGAEWIYRINDDQTFETPWAKEMTGALREMGPPYGVVGPTCPQGAQAILIVDFVHRTHHDIFPTHYPPSLMAWWMDNWATLVYGRERTRRLPNVKVTHLLNSHGTRYQGMFYFGQFLRGEKIRSRQMIEMYLAHTPGMEKQLQRYRQDSFSYTV